MNRLKQLVHEIHRRSLWQVLGIYLVGGWVVFEVVQTATEGLGLPEWFPAFAALLLLIGFPIVMATAFVQEGLGSKPEPQRPPLSEAIGREEDAVAQSARSLFTWRNALLGGMAAFALWGIVAAGWVLLAGGLREVASPSSDRPSIAVLPFDNLSPDPDNAYFAAGIHEEILTHLARIAALKVTSRTSVLEYAELTQNLREIADELDVNHVLEGSVRRDGDRILITVQLIDARSDEHLWAESYERDLSDIFAIQADVARRVAEQLEATLAPEVLARIDAPPTQDPEAYALYLQALESGVNVERERLLRQAVERDPSFALAHAELARTHLNHYWWGEDHTEERLRTAKAALDRAFELDPGLPQAHLVAGIYHYWGYRDYVTAAREFTLAADGLPNAATLHEWLGNVFRRSGRWEEAVASYRTAFDLNPRSPGVLGSLGQTQGLMRHFADAEATFARLNALLGFPHRYAIRHLALDRGDGERAERMLDDRPQAATSMPYQYARAFLLQREYERAIDVVERTPGDFMIPSAIQVRSLFLGEIYDLLGEPELAMAHYDSARVDLEAVALERPSDDRVFGALAIAYAGLGRADDAVRVARDAVALVPPERDAFQGMNRVVDLATVYVMVGDFDAALEQLEWLLDNPSSITVGRLRAEPRWDPLRDDPRFQALLERYDTRN